MGTKAEEGDAMQACDDIGDLARQYLMEPGLRGLQQIDEQIDRAKGDSRWDDMSKWHRVRFRMIRLSRAGG
ncbi:MAG: hypothetical protein V4574_16515 [Pseudomonadota bacterium]